MFEVGTNKATSYRGKNLRTIADRIYGRSSHIRWTKDSNSPYVATILDNTGWAVAQIIAYDSDLVRVTIEYMEARDLAAYEKSRD